MISSPPRRIALIFGGVSPEHEISISSASQVADGLRRLGATSPLAVQPIYITREGRWVWGAADPDAAALREAPRWDVEPEHYGSSEHDFPAALARLAAEAPDAALLVLHGMMGEDGRIQGALDLAKIPYTGSGAAASALALDKARTQAILNAAGLPIAPSALAHADRPPDLAAIERAVGIPCVVKPTTGGSSVGISIVRERDALAEALAIAFEVNEQVLIERFIPGRELTCGLLERERELIALPVTEIIPPEGRYFDYETKYTPGMTRELTPAPIDEETTRTIQTLARAAHMTLGCRGFSRVDFILGAQRPVIIEINTIPGMTATSLLPQAAAAIGIEFSELLELMLDSARHD